VRMRPVDSKKPLPDESARGFFGTRHQALGTDDYKLFGIIILNYYLKDQIFKK